MVLHLVDALLIDRAEDGIILIVVGMIKPFLLGLFIALAIEDVEWIHISK